MLIFADNLDIAMGSIDSLWTMDDEAPSELYLVHVGDTSKSTVAFNVYFVSKHCILQFFDRYFMSQFETTFTIETSPIVKNEITKVLNHYSSQITYSFRAALSVNIVTYHIFTGSGN